MAFGLFSDHAHILFGIITLSLIVLFIIANKSDHSKSNNKFILGLILGGAIGNWIDRIRFHAVIDFIDFKIWPVFNLADSFITIGVFLYILSMFKTKEG